MLNRESVIPNLIWNPANHGRGSVLPQGRFDFVKDAVASDIGWMLNQVQHDERGHVPC
jgi:hypothetical protein